MSIKTKLLIFALCISLIPISIITTINYFNARSTIERQTLDWLTAVAESKKVHTLSFLDSKKGRVVDFSSDGSIRDILDTISSIGTQSDAVPVLNRHLKVNKKPLDRHITAIAVLDINGNVVASTNELWIGKDMSKENIFMSCVSKDYGEAYIGKSYNVPYLNENCIFISAPLTSRQENKTMGVIINAYDIAILDEITTKRAGMGESGEALLGMRKGDSVVFLTTLKYAPDMPLSKSVPLDSSGAKPMRLALKGEGGAIIAPDYRSIDVVAAYQYIPEMDWGLVTKIDKKEVFAPIMRLRIFTIILGCISAIVVIAIAIIISKRVTRPIQKLVERTRRVASGDLDFKTPTRTKDEIGILESSFDSMVHQVRNWNKDLKEQIHARTAELEAKNAELERYAYTVSHDLKSPLITIEGFLGLLERDAIKGDTKRVKKHVSRIHNAAKIMNQLLDELLELSKVGRIIGTKEEVTLNDLANEAVNLIRGHIKELGVQVEIAPDLPVVYVDRLRFVEVMQNLIDNAVKHMGKQTEPLIEIGTRQDNGEDVYYVRDNGIGIESRYHENVFGLFNKLEQKGEGTGIGLAIVKRIIEIHGGRIWVESEGKGKGSIFCFTIPEKGEMPDHDK